LLSVPSKHELLSPIWDSRFVPYCFPFTQRSFKSISDDLYSTTEQKTEFYRRYVGEISTGMRGESALSFVHFFFFFSKSMFHKLIWEITITRQRSVARGILKQFQHGATLCGNDDTKNI